MAIPTNFSAATARLLALAGFFLLLLGSSTAQAQYQLRGSVLDKETKEPIPFVSIGIPGTSLGTASNADGQFFLNLPSLPQRVVFSEIGHLRDTLVVTSTQKPFEVLLGSATITLPEVKVGSYAFQLVDRAYRHMADNYDTKFYGKAYYRQVTRIGAEPTELQEMIWNVKSNNARIEGTTTTQGRFAAKQALLNFTNFSFNTKGYGLYNPNADSTVSLALLSPNAVKNYYVELQGILEKGDANIAEITFETRPEVEGYQANGTVWIDTDTYKVVRFTITSPNYTSASQNPTYKLKNTLLTFDLSFQNTPDPVSPLDYMKVKLTADVLRPGTPITKLDVSSFTFFYDTNRKPTGIAYERGTLDEKDRETIRQAKYDPEFWANNPVVQRTPVEDEVIKSFEQKGAFGTTIKPKRK
ncbi:carboxypeptidase-like regulatory domain-containing protein [Hymenobacter profundi]|uniref:Carboxypeptidase-like regulatory domain-containing protein n=1 Tax=Hymenobacter profundi TaxID=1982110 RepID=A0ABS6X2P2_9BACT|nr:carboxypeptidase-like regulatory domain-containing protein [Hymenobacter profundi]MBW3130104.1 carboxypeptidase-like regulatory domain-containing protein [Hymenobacter profundi]